MATRRQVLKATAPALAALAVGGCALPTEGAAGRHVVVVGAGAFGSWTAWHLRRAGARVTLVDAWGPGNARSSSGGDTRVLRFAYGDDPLYTGLARRSRDLFLEHERLWGQPLFRRTGVVFLVHDDEDFELASLPRLEAEGLGYEVLDRDGLAARYPVVNLEGVRWGLVEQEAGVLLARRSCAAVVAAFREAGGSYRLARAEPGPLGPGRSVEASAGRLGELRLSDGAVLAADAFVFACGPWLGRLFPEVAPAPVVTPTRQEVFTFGVPPGDRRFEPPHLPVWADHGERFWYGIPGNEGRGFKLADDTRGEVFDPTDGDRIPSAAGLAAAREFLAHRFPLLADAPLLEARVCQYENSPDGDFLVDRHPLADDVWLVGGGSGHGFKHGPALGELVAGCVLGEREPEGRFGLGRLG